MQPPARQLCTLPGHKQGVLRLAFSPDGRILASSGRDVTIRLWDVATGEQLCEPGRPCASPREPGFFPGRRHPGFGRARHRVHLWRIAP